MESQPVAPPPKIVAPPQFDPRNILWYFGAIAATIAGIAVISDVGAEHRGLWILIVSFAFLAGAAGLCAFALRFGCWIPGGVMAASAAAFVPMFAYGFERLIGVWPKGGADPFVHFCGAPFSLVALTVAGGLVSFWLVRYSFVLLIVTWASLLGIQFLLPVADSHPSSNAHFATLILTGAAFVVLGMLLDARDHRAHAFWWHVVGLFAIATGLVYYTTTSAIAGFVNGFAGDSFAGGSTLTVLHRHAWPWIAMLVIGAVLVVASFPVRRATWAAFGIAGIYAPSLHYINEATGSWHFSLVMVFVGVAVVFVGAILDVLGTDWPRRLARPVATPHE